MRVSESVQGRCKRIARMPKRRKRYTGSYEYNRDQVDQVRYGLAAYRRRVGIGVPTLFNQMMEGLLPHMASRIPDRQTVREFLKGARQSDDKIAAYHDFLELVDGDLVKNMVFGDFMHEMGHVFTAMFMPIYGKAEGEFERLSEIARTRYEGIYVPGRNGAFHIDPDYPEVLYLSAVGGAPYMSATIFSFYTERILEAVGGDNESLIDAFAKFHETESLIEGGAKYFHARYHCTIRVLEELERACSKDSKLLEERFFKRASGVLICRDTTNILCFTRKYDNAPCFYTLAWKHDRQEESQPNFVGVGLNSADFLPQIENLGEGDAWLRKVHSESNRDRISNNIGIFTKLELHKVEGKESILWYLAQNYAM